MTPDLTCVSLSSRPQIPGGGRRSLPASVPPNRTKAGATALRPLLAASLVALGALAPLAGQAWEVRGGGFDGDRAGGGGAYHFSGSNWQGGYNGGHA